ncbi:hypothetical protein GCM10011571_19650 [Marinithermofilum abyssi]|uniref:Uncharacterized protein n=1 Tax=Marinithermofilum abyssi TaxID=1571185 RepID=A0A8J2YAQ1_9BACL|nr:hypothetical protein [Marinithermofilum abyssi]GGE17933.1 hypothetical protein GCM10011571_19650 [Marinithermofilum abyssi]
MGTFFNLLFSRHGLKLWGTFLLGVLIHIAISIVIYLLFVIAGVLLGAFGGLGLALTQADPEAAMNSLADSGVAIIVALVLLFIVYFIVMMMPSAFYYAGMYGMVRETVFDNRTRFTTFFTQGFRFWLRAFWWHLLVALFALPTFIPAVIGLVLIEQNPDTTLGIVFLIGTYVLLLIYAFFTMYSPVIMVTDNVGAFRSILLSHKLVFRRFGTVFMTLLYNLLIFFGFIAVSFLIGGMITILVPDFASDKPGALGASLQLITTLAFFLAIFYVTAANLLIQFLRYKWYLRPVLFPDADAKDIPPSNQAKGAYPQFPQDPHWN